MHLTESKVADVPIANNGNGYFVVKYLLKYHYNPYSPIQISEMKRVRNIL